MFFYKETTQFLHLLKTDVYFTEKIHSTISPPSQFLFSSIKHVRIFIKLSLIRILKKIYSSQKYFYFQYNDPKRFLKNNFSLILKVCQLMRLSNVYVTPLNLSRRTNKKQIQFKNLYSLKNIISERN